MEVTQTKHLTFAVRDIAASLDAYKRLLGVAPAVEITEFAKSRNKTAVFALGGIEF